MKRIALVALVPFLAWPSFAAESPWNGTWKLDEAKSHVGEDEPMTINQSADGKYHIVDGDAKYACDGKDYPIGAISGAAIACTASGATALDVTVKVNGKAMGKTHESLSEDDQVLTAKATRYNPDGTTTDTNRSYKRLSGSKGLVGEWKEMKKENSAPEIMSISVTGQSMKVSDPSTGKTEYDAKLDGTPTGINGMPNGFKIELKQENPSKVSWNMKLNGSIVLLGSETVSQDGKTLTQEKWSPGKESEKQILVFDKQ